MTTFRPQRRAFRVRWVTFLQQRLRQAARSVELGNMHPTQAVLSVPSVRQGSMWTRRATMLKQSASAVRAERMWTWRAALSSQTALHVPLVGMEQEAALRVSAVATVLWVGTPRGRLVQVQRRLTALHVTLVGMALAAALRVSALVTVLWAGTRRVRVVWAQQRLTVRHARLGHTWMPRAALSVSSALLVRTRMQ